MNLSGNYVPRPEYAVQPSEPFEQEFRHSGWAVRRLQIWRGLNRVHVNQGQLDRFRNCGSAVWLQVKADGSDLRLTCNACHNRWCAICAAAKSARIGRALHGLIGNAQPLFITLTLKHSATPLAEQLDRLFTCFTALRRRSIWADNIRAAAAFVELKLGASDGLWHVHLHLLALGGFIDQKALSSAWHGVTGNSFIVDVRRPPAVEKVARYVVKYVTKPASSDVLRDPAKLDEMLLALKGRRLCATYGEWRNVPLDDPPDDAGEWVTVCSVSSLFSVANDHAPESARWREAVRRKWPDLLDAMFRPPGPSG